MALLADFMLPFVEEVELLLTHSKVLLYSGQLDIIIGAATTEAYLPFLAWPGAVSFAAADRAVWRLDPSDPEVAGSVTARPVAILPCDAAGGQLTALLRCRRYATAGGNLTYVMIRGAGEASCQCCFR